MAAILERKQTNGDLPHSHAQSDTSEEFESHCGMGACKPKCLQRCNNILSFSIFYGLTNLVTQTLGVYIVSQITAIEKQFKINSTTTGLILSCNDIGFLCTVLFLGHFGKFSHVPRFLFVACCLYGIGGIVSSMSYFVDPYYLPKLSAEDGIQNSTKTVDFSTLLCIPGNATSAEACLEGNEAYTSGQSKWPIWMFSGSMVLQGIGKSPRSPLGISYIDTNNPVKSKTGIYLGIMMTMMMLGPPLAIVLGGAFRRIPADLQATTLTPSHPQWLGAWWLGFLVFGCLGLVIGIPLLFFPKNMLPPECHNDNSLSLSEKIKDLPRSLVRVMKSPVYTLVLIGLLALMFMYGGLTSFSSKYVEKQFMVPAYKSNILLGVQSIIGVSVGTLLGGILTSRLKLTRLGCMKLVMFALIISQAFSVIEFFLGCNTPWIHGFHDKSKLRISTGGVADCVCQTTEYFPVCGDGKNTYFSPCFAGCTNQSRTVYGGCSEVSSGVAVAGMCETECPYLYYYLAADLGQKLLGTMSIMPIYVVMLRSVTAKDKSIAFALLSFLGSLFGFMPAPILFGYIIDKTCLIWEQTCGVTGACAQYDLMTLRYFMKTAECTGKAVCSIFFIASMFVLKSQGKDDERAGLQLSMKAGILNTEEMCKDDERAGPQLSMKAGIVNTEELCKDDERAGPQLSMKAGILNTEEMCKRAQKTESSHL